MEWPPEDLASLLVDAFFTKASLALPIIHRPTFDKNIQDGLHLRDSGYAKLVLLVYAMGSRYIDDPRVCMLDENGEHDLSSAGMSIYAGTLVRRPYSDILTGWKYFKQIMSLKGKPRC